MSPHDVAARLRELAADLESGSGRIRWLLVVACPEHASDRIAAGPGFFQLLRDDADPHELHAAASEVVQRLGDTIVAVS